MCKLTNRRAVFSSPPLLPYYVKTFRMWLIPLIAGVLATGNAIGQSSSPVDADDEGLYVVPLCMFAQQYSKGEGNQASAVRARMHFGVSDHGWTQLSAACGELAGGLQGIAAEAQGRLSNGARADSVFIAEYDARFHSTAAACFERLHGTLHSADWRSIRTYLAELRANTTGGRLN